VSNLRGHKLHQLYSVFRSGTSHRLRIALHLKDLAYDYEAVDLHLGAAYVAVHPQGLVPALQTDGGEGLLIQSPAIIEWLEERHPQPPLLPADPGGTSPGGRANGHRRLRLRHG
jgi:maleylpyruvate isomerase